ncbi:MFS transporter [Rhodocyclus tenuis]|uniref:MFS family permease n=1 Tax=Rhodocyclus tenuis TaxID=1066 RepID=A0A840GE34_RHOTE|nr:MFS transporter [Rhodocyclus tenuis]MBB4246479.1 MFS family permease [Rhodocyclus tenuis]
MSQLFAQRRFMRFWLARISGTTANQMLMVAVAWQMYELTESAWDLGLVGLFQFVPALLLTLPAGQVVDRVRRSSLFALTMLGQGSVALLLVWATLAGFVSREVILGVSVVLGVARAFQMPAQQAIVPLLVPESMLARAIALSAMGMQAAVIGGPALGGLLYVRGAVDVYAVCTTLLLLAFVLALLIRERHQPAQEAATLRSMLAGVVFVWNNKLLLGATSLDLFAVLLGGATALLPIYARDILHTGPEGLGLLRAAPAAGALLMSLLILRWPIHRRAGHVLLASVAVFGVATIVFGLSESFWLSLLALAITGAADNISVVIRSTLMQIDTPNEIRGRVSAVNSIFIGASNQLGEFESGAAAAALGAVGSVVLGGVATVFIAAGWFRLFPALAQRDQLVQDKPANP